MPYTTFQVVDNLIQTAAKAERFFHDCKLNNKDKMKIVCQEKCNGYKVEKIAKDNDLTKIQAQKFIKLCTLCPMTNSDKKLICRAKNDYNQGLDAIAIDYDGKYTKDQIKAVFDKCKRSTDIPSSIVNIICNAKKQNVPLQYVYFSAPGYTKSQVKDVYENKCQS